MNNVCIMGTITRDPQLSYLPTQTAVCELSIALNEKYKDKETVSYFDCQSYGKTAENINKYFKKGSRILLTGKLKQDRWDGKDGGKRSKVRIIVLGFDFVDRAKKEQSKPPADMGFGNEEPVF